MKTTNNHILMVLFWRKMPVKNCTIMKQDQGTDFVLRWQFLYWIERFNTIISFSVVYFEFPFFLEQDLHQQDQDFHRQIGYFSTFKYIT